MTEEQIKELLKTKSRTEIGLCKNNDCYNKRRYASAYCQECSNKHRLLNKTI